MDYRIILDRLVALYKEGLQKEAPEIAKSLKVLVAVESEGQNKLIVFLFPKPVRILSDPEERKKICSALPRLSVPARRKAGTRVEEYGVHASEFGEVTGWCFHMPLRALPSHLLNQTMKMRARFRCLEKSRDFAERVSELLEREIACKDGETSIKKLLVLYSEADGDTFWEDDKILGRQIAAWLGIKRLAHCFCL
ncbi:hypothetical protein HYW53_01140 [Candidatus Giovannonibacteria bacterium]|nr:hypothetical protein [Candidatus Giovannonibacteria bacterium]